MTSDRITRRYTREEMILAVKHVRYDFTDEPAKAIAYTLTEHFQRIVMGPTYAVSYDAGEGFFFATFIDVGAKTLLLHERNLEYDGDCWCLPMSDTQLNRGENREETQR